MDKLKYLENAPDSAFSEVNNDISEQEFTSTINQGGQNAEPTAQNFDTDSPEQPQQEAQQPTFEFLDSTIVIGVIDSFLPAVIVWIYSATMNMKVNKSAFMLTAAEKKTLEPILKECLKTINIDLSNPWKALMITAGMIYAGKVFTAPTEPQPVKIADSQNAPRVERRGRPRKTI